MGRGRKVFAAACAVSLLIHLGVMGSAGRWWEAPREEVPFPLQARLVEPRPKPAGAPRPASPLAPDAAANPATDPATPSPVMTSPAPAQQEPEAAEMSGSPTAGATAPADLVPAASPAEAMPETAPPAAAPAPAGMPGARVLPERLTLVYDVYAGEDGLRLGQATYTWRAQGGRYRLESVAEAQGLAALFVSGRIVQSSEGSVTPAGLQPETFRMTKNKRREDSAHFDWARRELTLPRGREPLRDNTQDLLSFPFHLSMTVDESRGDWVLPVTNGRKLKGYRFTILARARLETGEGALDTLHLQGSRVGEGALDVWLAPARDWLPVRIRTQDEKGQVVQMNLVRRDDGPSPR
ncbi:MAG: DUF3108 domain-containing protein [Pseudomonadota bacterium]